MSEQCYSRQDLMKTQLQLIRSIKLEFKKEKDLVKRAENFKAFVGYCRDRKFNSVAGYTESPANSGRFYWRR